jgi:hypothetical protein
MADFKLGIHEDAAGKRFKILAVARDFADPTQQVVVYRTLKPEETLVMPIVEFSKFIAAAKYLGETLKDLKPTSALTAGMSCPGRGNACTGKLYLQLGAPTEKKLSQPYYYSKWLRCDTCDQNFYNKEDRVMRTYKA